MKYPKTDLQMRLLLVSRDGSNKTRSVSRVKLSFLPLLSFGDLSGQVHPSFVSDVLPSFRITHSSSPR